MLLLVTYFSVSICDTVFLSVLAASSVSFIESQRSHNSPGVFTYKAVTIFEIFLKGKTALIIELTQIDFTDVIMKNPAEAGFFMLE